MSDSEEVDLIDFYKIVLKEFRKSKQKPSAKSKYEEFCAKFKLKLLEIQQELSALDDLDGEGEGDGLEDSSDLDSLEAFNALDQTDEVEMAIDPVDADKIDPDGIQSQDHEIDIKSSPSSEGSQQGFGKDFNFY